MDNIHIVSQDAELRSIERKLFSLAVVGLLLAGVLWVILGWLVSRAFSVSSEAGWTALATAWYGWMCKDAKNEWPSMAEIVRKGWPR